MRESRIWQLLVLGLIASLLQIGHQLHSAGARGPSIFAQPAFAGVAVANEDDEIVFSSSADGKTIYMWQYYSSKPPKYLGKAEAIATE